MIWVYGAAGLVAFVIVVAVTVGAIASVKSKGSFRVELDVPEYYGYTGKIAAAVDSEEDAFQLMLAWRHWIDQDEKGEEPQPYNAAKHAGRIP